MDNHSQSEGESIEPGSGESRLSDGPRGGNFNSSQSPHSLEILSLFSPARFLMITIGGIFLAEIAAMLLIYRFRTWPYYVQTIIDASIMILMIYPLLYNFSLRPLIRHIDERKRSQERLQLLNRSLKVLSKCNEVLVRAESETELLDRMCEIIVDIGGHRMAWVGFAEHDAEKRVLPVSQSGFEDGYLSLAQITWDDTESGRGPTGIAVRTGVTQVNQNFLTNPNTTLWRDSALQRGYQSSIALPLKTNQGILGALTIYSSVPDAFDREEVGQLSELAADLAFGITALRDRAERKLAEELLHEMALFPAFNPDAVLQVDAKGLIRKTNPAAIRLGLLPGAQLTELIPDLLELDLEYYITSGLTYQVSESRLYDRVLFWTIKGVAELGIAFLYSTDITELKHAEDAIHRLSRIVEQTDDTVMVTDPEGVIEYVNASFERLTGYTRGDVVGITPRVLKSGLHNVRFYRELWDTILKGNVFIGEIANCKKSGELFYEMKTISPLRDAHGEITHFVATGKDITSHKLAEEKLRKAYDELEQRVRDRTEELQIANSELADEIAVRERTEEALREAKERLDAHLANSPLAIIEFDPAYRVITWSGAAERIFGWKENEMIGQAIAEIRWVHEDDVESVQRVSEEMSTGRRPRNQNVNRNYRKDGSIVHCEWYNSAIYDEQGRLLSVFSQILDITQRKQAEEELRVVYEELTRFNHSMVGRELRMIELKKEVNGLCAQVSQPPRYSLEFEKEG